jgi:alpha-amylase
LSGTNDHLGRNAVADAGSHPGQQRGAFRLLCVGTLNEFQYTFAMKSVFRNENGSQHRADAHDHGHARQLGRQLGLHSKRQGDRVRQQLGYRAQRQLAGGQRLHLPATNDTQGTKRYDLANIFMLAWPYGHAQLHSGYRFSNGDQAPAERQPVRCQRQSVDQPVWDFIHRWSDIANMVKFRATWQARASTTSCRATVNQIAFGRGNKGFVAMNNEARHGTRHCRRSCLPAPTATWSRAR